MQIKNDMNRLAPHLNPLKPGQGQVPGAAAQPVTPTADSVRLNSPGLRALVEEAAQAAPDIRAERVADARARLDDGSYNIDGKDIADKLFESARELF